MLISAGYSVSVIALGEKGQPASEVIDGVQVYRAPKLELFKKTPSASDRLLPRLTVEGTGHQGAPPDEVEELVPVGPGAPAGR